jgi:hypothetical protein
MASAIAWVVRHDGEGAATALDHHFQMAQSSKVKETNCVLDEEKIPAKVSREFTDLGWQNGASPRSPMS